MRYDPERVAAAFNKLFQTYPSFQAGAADDALRVYFEAVEPYVTGDIEVAIQNFITGSAPGHNPAFAPSAPQVGAEVRRVMNLRVEAAERDRRYRPALPPPDIEKSSEAQARVAALAMATVERLAGAMRTDEAAAHRARLKRTNEYFDARRSYEAGDAVQDENAA